MAITSALQMESILNKGRCPVVLSDIDKTMRWDKGDVSRETQDAIMQFQQGGLFIPITGAPLLHIPKFLCKFPLAFAESGAVVLFSGRAKVLASLESLEALGELKCALGIFDEQQSVRLANGIVLLEGPRMASLTLVSGKHPDFPDQEGTVDIEGLAEEIQMIIRQRNLPLGAYVGTASTYSWIDVRTLEKEDVVSQILEVLNCQEVCYFGDGMNDYGAMSLDRVRPLTFCNGVQAVKDLVVQKGYQVIQLAGPDGGLAQGLRMIQSRGCR